MKKILDEGEMCRFTSVDLFSAPDLGGRTLDFEFAPEGSRGRRLVRGIREKLDPGSARLKPCGRLSWHVLETGLTLGEWK